MKMKPEHYAILLDAMRKIAHQSNPKAYRDRGLSPVRFRWDALWACKIEGMRSCQWMVRNLQYLYDTHVDTALRRIAREVWPDDPWGGMKISAPQRT